MILKINLFKFFFLLFFLFSSHLNANNIAVFNMNKVFLESINFQNFIEKIKKDKKKEIDFLSTQKNNIQELEKKIDTDKLILDNNELNSLIESYHNSIDEYNQNISIIEKKYEKVIGYNEKILVKSIANIVKDIATLNDLELVLTETSYFLTSDKIDITKQIIEEINNININFEYNIE